MRIAKVHRFSWKFQIYKMAKFFYTAVSLESEQLREERKICLKSLWFKKNKTDSRTKGTFEWIWESPTIVKWYEAKNGTIWIQAKAGSGKSTMMQYLFETEQARSTTENPKTIVAHFSFFSQDADGPQSSMKGRRFFASLSETLCTAGSGC